MNVTIRWWKKGWALNNNDGPIQVNNWIVNNIKNKFKRLWSLVSLRICCLWCFEWWLMVSTCIWGVSGDGEGVVSSLLYCLGSSLCLGWWAREGVDVSSGSCIYRRLFHGGDDDLFGTGLSFSSGDHLSFWLPSLSPSKLLLVGRASQGPESRGSEEKFYLLCDCLLVFTWPGGNVLVFSTFIAFMMRSSSPFILHSFSGDFLPSFSAIQAGLIIRFSSNLNLM